MALAKITVTRIIAIVAADEECMARIQSFLAMLPMGKRAGFARNIGLALSQGLWDLNLPGRRYAEGRWGVDFGEYPNPFNPNYDMPEGHELTYGHKLNCEGIALAAEAAINKKMAAIPAVASVAMVPRADGLAHFAVKVDTTDGGQYILDWWMSLDVAKPYVFPFKGWNLDKKETGIKYADFGGFP